MLERLARWNGPEGASPAEVAHLREELVGVIHHTPLVPGQSLDDAKADLTDRLEDKMHIFQQDQTLGGLVHEEQREDQQHALEVAHDQHFNQFQQAIAESVKDWHPAWWGEANNIYSGPRDDAGLAQLKSQVNALLVSTQIDPNKPVAAQEDALRAAVHGLMQTYQNDTYTEYGKNLDAEYQRRFDASFSAPGGGEAERNHVNFERPGVATMVAGHLQEPVGDDLLPTPPPLPEELQASAARIAERERVDLDPSSGIDPSKLRTIADRDQVPDAFDSGGDPMLQGATHHEPLGDTTGASPTPVTAPNASADATMYDPTGSDAATHHLTTILTGETRDALAHEQFDAAAPAAHDGTSAPMDPFGSHEPGASIDAADPAHAAPVHDPLFGDVEHHDGGQMDPTHHDPTGADAVHHDPTGADASSPALPHVDPAVPEHPLDDPSLPAPIAPEVPEHDFADPSTYDPAMDTHDDAVPAYEPAPAMSSPDDDQY
jgi:hypothetical protein